LRLTIVSNDENDLAGKPGVDTDKDGGDADKAGHEKRVDSIAEMYPALRTCWMPPPKDSARHGMEYTVRFALKRDGEIMAPPRVTYSSHDAPAGVRDVYRDASARALHAAAFQRPHGSRCSRPPNCPPFRGQPGHRRRKVSAITATVSLRRHIRSASISGEVRCYQHVGYCLHI
jgi:hypothetical protein